MAVPTRYSFSNWTVDITTGKTGFQQLAALGGILTDFSAPSIEVEMDTTKRCSLPGEVAFPLSTTQMEMTMTITLDSDSLEAAIGKIGMTPVIVVLSSTGVQVTDTTVTKNLVYTLTGFASTIPFGVEFEAQKTQTSTFKMAVNKFVKSWGTANYSYEPGAFNWMDGTTNLLNDLKLGLNF